MRNVIKILIFGVFFAVLIIPAIQSVLTYEKAKTYVATQGTVSAVAGYTAKDVSLPPGKRTCGLWYIYSVNGMQYKGDTISPEQGGGPDSAKCRVFLNGFNPQIGDKIEVYYDPAIPSDALAFRDFPFYSVRAAIIYSLFLILLLLFMHKVEKYVRENTIKTYR